MPMPTGFSLKPGSGLRFNVGVRRACAPDVALEEAGETWPVVAGNVLDCRRGDRDGGEPLDELGLFPREGDRERGDRSLVGGTVDFMTAFGLLRGEVAGEVVERARGAVRRAGRGEFVMEVEEVDLGMPCGIEGEFGTGDDTVLCVSCAIRPAANALRFSAIIACTAVLGFLVTAAFAGFEDSVEALPALGFALSSCFLAVASRWSAILAARVGQMS